MLKRWNGNPPVGGKMVGVGAAVGAGQGGCPLSNPPNLPWSKPAKSDLTSPTKPPTLCSNHAACPPNPPSPMMNFSKPLSAGWILLWITYRTCYQLGSNKTWTSVNWSGSMGLLFRQRYRSIFLMWSTRVH